MSEKESEEPRQPEDAQSGGAEPYAIPQEFFVRLEDVPGRAEQTAERLRAERNRAVHELAGTASLPEPRRTTERERAQAHVDRLDVQLDTLDSTRAIEALARGAIAAAETRAAESAAREASVVRMTRTLVRVTWGIAAVAVLTLAAAIVTLVIAA